MCDGHVWMNNGASTGVHSDLSRKWGSVPVAVENDVIVNVLDIPDVLLRSLRCVQTGLLSARAKMPSKVFIDMIKASQ